ncbi:MAG: hypothetical protein JWQ79_2602 [Mucilaginibacter sp.]|nr:hypothetical protein [Mucilaginibacter sp.]
MIIYNKTWLSNLYLHKQSEQLRAAGCLTHEELATIKAKYLVGFYTPGIFIRIGLFLLTCIIISFSFGLLSLMFTATQIIETPGWSLFLGIICVVALEYMVKTKNHYRSGVDDALQWIAFGTLAGSITWLIFSLNHGYQDPSYLTISLVVFITSSYFTLRFANIVMGAATCISFFAVLFFAWKNTGAFGNATMPFLIMLVSAIAYVLALRLSHQLKTPFYAPIIIDIQMISLLVLYAAGNYFVIDNLNNTLNETTGTATVAKIPFAFFFWMWTMLLPLVYIARGIMKKDVIILRIGLLLAVAAIYTFRNYYHILSIELALIAGGIILLAITYSVIRYLKIPRHRFTYADTDNTDTMDSIKLESLIAAETLGHVPGAPTTTANRFGGGDFGGGGSGGGF